jgi:hypothetical protein
VNRRVSRWAARAAFLAGLALAVVAVLGWRVPSASGQLGLDVRLTAASTGELEVEPAGAFLVGSRLVPLGARTTARGETTVRNQTPSRLRVRVRVLPESRALDRLLHVGMSLGGRTIGEGTLAALREWSRPVGIPPGERRALAARVWLPAASGSGYEGRIEDVALEFRSRMAKTERP